MGDAPNIAKSGTGGHLQGAWLLAILWMDEILHQFETMVETIV